MPHLCMLISRMCICMSCISDMRLPLEVKLEAKLAQVPEWAAASPWHLRVTAESSGRKATEDSSSWRKTISAKFVMCFVL